MVPRVSQIQQRHLSNAFVLKDLRADNAIVRLRPVTPLQRSDLNRVLMRCNLYEKSVNINNFFLNLIVDIDECLTNPCKNLGTCENTAGSFGCLCYRGFYGPTCTGNAQIACHNALKCMVCLVTVLYTKQLFTRRSQ